MTGGYEAKDLVTTPTCRGYQAKEAGNYQHAEGIRPKRRASTNVPRVSRKRHPPRSQGFQVRQRYHQYFKGID